MKDKICANCKFMADNYCGYVECDDEDYPHSNSLGFGIVVEALDDQGLMVDLRVDDDFGCVKFEEREEGK